MPLSGSAKGIAFLVLLSRAADRGQIDWIYLVGAKEAADVYNSMRTRRRPIVHSETVTGEL